MFSMLLKWRYAQSFRPWHPDFKGMLLGEKQPIKFQGMLVVILVFVFCLSLGAYGWLEWRYQNIQQTQQRRLAGIRLLEKNNQLYLSQSFDFQSIIEEENVLLGFVGPTRLWMEWLIAILQSPMQGMIFDQIDAKLVTPKKLERKTAKKIDKKTEPSPYLEIVLKGFLRGAPEDALQVLERYKNALQAISILKDHIAVIEVGRVIRDEKSEQMNFDLLLRLNLLK